MIKLEGILPPMLTPFKGNGEVDYSAFARNIDRWNKEPLAGYLVLGSNSETAYLSEKEKLKLIELAVETAAKGRVVLAGTGLESTQATIALTNKAAKLGADAALVLTPSFYTGQMTDEALIRHYTAVAESAEIPVLIYNVPKFTHFNISADAVRTLSRHSNIIGMKDSAGDIAQLEAFKQAAPKEFTLIAGSASVLYPALKLGVRAAIVALANCAPGKCAEMQRLYDAGKHEHAQMLQSRMIPVNKAVTDTYGIAGLKYACTLTGYEGGSVRSPLMPLRDSDKHSIRALLIEAGFAVHQ
jgi:4-hydroxy-2-oxoglutarate aldolase